METNLTNVVDKEKKSCEHNCKPNLSEGNSNFIEHKVNNQQYWRHNNAPNDNFLSELVNHHELSVVIQLLIILDPHINKQILQHSLVILVIIHSTVKPAYKMSKIDK